MSISISIEKKTVCRKCYNVNFYSKFRQLFFPFCCSPSSTYVAYLVLRIFFTMPPRPRATYVSPCVKYMIFLLNFVLWVSIILYIFTKLNFNSLNMLMSRGLSPKSTQLVADPIYRYLNAIFWFVFCTYYIWTPSLLF